MITVRVHAGCHRQAHGVEHRGDRAGHGPDVRLQLADIVKEGSLDRSGVIGKGYRHTPGDVNSMPLICRTLEPEQVGAGAVEVFVDEALIIGTWSGGTDMPEETSDEVTDLVETTGHEAACLHLMQRRTAGKYSMRSEPIWVPQVSHTP